MFLRFLLIAIGIYFLYRFLDSLLYKLSGKPKDYSSSKRSKQDKKAHGEYVDYEEIE